MTHNTHGLFRENASAILILQRLIDPIVTVLMLFIIAWVYDLAIETPHLIHYNLFINAPYF